MDLVPRDLGDQPVIGLLDGRAVVDDRVDFTGDRHVQAESP